MNPMTRLTGSTRSGLALLLLLGSFPCLAGPARAELRDTRRIERSFPAAGVRELAGGGPELRLETLNGDLILRQAHRKQVGGTEP